MKRVQEDINVPLRTNITPDQSVGSPGVRLTNTPCGHACLRPPLVGLLASSSLRFGGFISTIRQGASVSVQPEAGVIVVIALLRASP